MPQTPEARKKKYHTDSEFKRKELERRKEARRNKPWYATDRTFRVLGDTSTYERETEIFRPAYEAGEDKRELAIAFLDWRLDMVNPNHPDAGRRLNDLSFRKSVLEQGPGASLIPVYRVGLVAQLLRLTKDEFDYLEKKGIIPKAVSFRGSQGGREYPIPQIILMKSVFAEAVVPEADPDSETWKAGCRKKKPLLRNTFDLRYIAEALHKYWMEPHAFPFGGGRQDRQEQIKNRFARVMFHRRSAEDRKQNPDLYKSMSM